LTRLRANTTYNQNSINTFLTEHAPNSRVLSGESIIFQNETLDLFKAMINNSAHPLEQIPESERVVTPLKARYVITVLSEFLRCLLENSIPQQPAQQ